jgi:hypothetical protein
MPSLTSRGNRARDIKGRTIHIELGLQSDERAEADIPILSGYSLISSHLFSLRGNCSFPNLTYTFRNTAAIFCQPSCFAAGPSGVPVRFYQALLCLSALLVAGSARTAANFSAAQSSLPFSAGCGATRGGATQFDQSACGNVKPFPMAATGKAIASCQTLKQGTYHLNANIGAAATSTCLTLISGPVTLDLAGFTITGRIVGNNIALSRTHFFSSAGGGMVTCSDAVSSPGCIFLQGSDNVTGVLEIDHLTLVNIATSSSNSERNLFIDWGAAASTSLGNATSVKIHNISSTSATGASNNRIVNLHIQASVPRVEYYNNDTTCLAGANACQGTVCYGVKDCKIHNNRATTQLGVGISETARAFLCDGDTGVGMNGCEIYNNYVNTQDGRAIRFRNVNSSVNITAVHDNLIDNIASGSTGNYASAIHLCDPDTGTNDGSSYLITANTFKMRDGSVVVARGCRGFPQVNANVVVCIAACTGLFSNVRQSDGGASTLKLVNNAPMPLTSRPQNQAEAGTSLEICNSGTSGGRATITTACGTAPR